MNGKRRNCLSGCVISTHELSYSNVLHICYTIIVELYSTEYYTNFIRLEYMFIIIIIIKINCIYYFYY